MSSEAGIAIVRPPYTPQSRPESLNISTFLIINIFLLKIKSINTCKKPFIIMS